LKRMLDAGLLVTVNSDDPPYFGGYVNETLPPCKKHSIFHATTWYSSPEIPFRRRFCLTAEKQDR